MAGEALGLRGENLRYGDWHIQFDPPPIPARSMDWHYWHDDFDGAPDACDNRYGSVASLVAAMDAIDDYEAEQFEEHGCTHGCRLGIEPGPFECMSTNRCRHRGSVRARLAFREKICPSSPDGRHQVDTSMESGPNNCFHCEKPMPRTLSHQETTHDDSL